MYKEPVQGRVMAHALGLDGDTQADLTVHGGTHKAVYAYPEQHYAYWRAELPDMELPLGMFGENLTVEGMSEDQVNLGDRYRVGEAEVTVTQPRLPCFKLGIKFGRTDIIKRFLASGRTGFYFLVAREGEVGAGDAIELISRDENQVSVSDAVRLYQRDHDDIELMRRVVLVEAVPEDWRLHLRERIKKATRGKDGCDG